MPNVLLEAMASGLPVVATDAEGVVELLGQNGTEQVVARGDATAFASQIIRLCKDRDLAAQRGEENCRIARTDWGLERMIARYEDLYESLCGSESGTKLD
jgi:glycosyltransferase involved in cell wall biosynthesis